MIKKKILIIDDSELMLKMISDILVSAGFDVVTANNGKTGIKKVREEKPDLVILDIIMPEMNGFEVCKILREDESNNLMPIIIVTAKENEEDKLVGLDIGADDYMIKPANPRELVSRVRNTLKRVDRNRWANPLTGLQGNIEIQSEINRRIARNEIFSVIYADIDNFKAYNDVYSFARGDTAIKLTADIIINSIKLYGHQDDFIGHIGGDDFIIITCSDEIDKMCEKITKDFDEKILSLYSLEDKKNKYIITKNRAGEEIKFPILSLSLVIVSNEHRRLLSHLHISEIAAELKKKAKESEGSIYIKDRRKRNS